MKKKTVTSRKIDLEQVKELLESGLSNVQIAAIIGRHSSTVGDYRDTYRDWETDRKSTRLNSSH